MIYPIGTICTMANKDGMLDIIYVGREVTVVSAPQFGKFKNRHGDVCEYEGYGVDVEGETNLLFVKHVWLVPKKFPEDGKFTEFMTKVLKPVDIRETGEV